MDWSTAKYYGSDWDSYTCPQGHLPHALTNSAISPHPEKIGTWFVCLWLLYVRATCKVISGQVPTCDSAHSLWLYSAASLGHQATSTMTCFPTQSLSWHWGNQSLPYSNNAECMARNRQVSFLKFLIWLDQVSNQWALDSNARSSDSPIPGRWALYSFGHPDWSIWEPDYRSDMNYGDDALAAVIIYLTRLLLPGYTYQGLLSN